ncbi:uncharacterized protein C8A04DRAFT_30621 [Dichotomopilus funicola]|uniref:Uncharacterized protein n=1 Tax=Dichotomopilus funicola TaxID=1934379 RepID=A0AAN6UZ68_9PEZI|nr:hypothetical protein C8A04DRAFT_30621 [Dichotomopilus funicola]
MPDKMTQTDPLPGSTPQTSSASSPLEKMPLDIHRLIILQLSSFNDLDALVHASPRAHLVYARDRLSILRHMAERVLDGFLYDAHAAYLSGKARIQTTRLKGTLWQFLDQYRFGQFPSLKLKDLIQLVRFHRFVIEPLTKHYEIWALDDRRYYPEHSYPLSRTEIQRVQRALYRLEVYYNICSPAGKGRSGETYIEKAKDRMRLLALFAPWQIEQILCVHEFTMHVCDELFRELKWELQPLQDKEFGAMDVQSGEDISYLFLDAGQSSNLPLVSTVLKISDPEEQAAVLRECLLGLPSIDDGRDWIVDATLCHPKQSSREILRDIFDCPN